MRINNAKAKTRLYTLSDGGGFLVEVSPAGQEPGASSTASLAVDETSRSGDTQKSIGTTRGEHRLGIEGSVETAFQPPLAGNMTASSCPPAAGRDGGSSKGQCVPRMWRCGDDEVTCATAVSSSFRMPH